MSKASIPPATRPRLVLRAETAAPAAWISPGPDDGAAGAAESAGADRGFAPRLLYRADPPLGLALTWHEYASPEPVLWGGEFGLDRITICLNLTGQGRLTVDGRAVDYRPLTAAYFCPGTRAPGGWRWGLERQQYVLAQISADFIRRSLEGRVTALHPPIRDWLVAFERGDPEREGYGAPVSPLNRAQQTLVLALRHASWPGGAGGLWYQAKILELMAQYCVAPVAESELFCERQQRLARERVERVSVLLSQGLADPPSLEEIGRQVGCSPFYLSRTFSREMGMTIPQYLRQLRMERAAELLRSGRYNVTEAALEVGYSSLSHFSQAFCQVMGCCPGLYPLKAPAAGAPPIETQGIGAGDKAGA